MKYRTALYGVRGLGSAKDGTHHWWMQRLTAVALVPLMLWLAFALASLGSMDYASAATWLAAPLNTVLMLASIVALFHHAQLGVQVVVEDYVHREAVKITALVLLKFITLLLGLASALAVLRVSLSG